MSLFDERRRLLGPNNYYERVEAGVEELIATGELGLSEPNLANAIMKAATEAGYPPDCYSDADLGEWVTIPSILFEKEIEALERLSLPEERARRKASNLYFAIRVRGSFIDGSHQLDWVEAELSPAVEEELRRLAHESGFTFVVARSRNRLTLILQRAPK